MTVRQAGYDSETSDDEDNEDDVMAAVNIGSQLKYSEALEYSLLQSFLIFCSTADLTF